MLKKHIKLYKKVNFISVFVNFIIKKKATISVKKHIFRKWK